MFCLNRKTGLRPLRKVKYTAIYLAPDEVVAVGNILIVRE